MSRAGEERRLAELPTPFPAPSPGAPPWEVELGFGKGRYLLRRALAEPACRFLGIEIAAEYYRILAERAARHGATNLIAVCGDALYLAAAVLPRHFARAVHVYFPDPWPKARHHKRRLFDPETIDLVLGLLAPGGELLFATDFLAYGELVAEILGGYPGSSVERQTAWPEGPRTNYEAKYVALGRPILRLRARLERAAEPPLLHPGGAAGILVAPRTIAARADPPLA